MLLIEWPVNVDVMPGPRVTTFGSALHRMRSDPVSTGIWMMAVPRGDRQLDDLTVPPRPSAWAGRPRRQSRCRNGRPCRGRP